MQQQLDFKKIAWFFIAILAMGVSAWSTLHEIPPRKAAVLTADIRRQETQAQLAAQQKIERERTAQKEADLKIAQVTGAVPNGYVIPSQAPQKPVSIYDAPVEKRTRHVEFGERLGLNQGLSFSFASSGDETVPSATIIVPYDIKRIDGGGQFKMESEGHSIGWSTASGEVTSEVRSFLEAHRTVKGAGNPRDIKIYTKGGVVFHF